MRTLFLWALMAHLGWNLPLLAAAGEDTPSKAPLLAQGPVLAGPADSPDKVDPADSTDKVDPADSSDKADQDDSSDMADQDDQAEQDKAQPLFDQGLALEKAKNYAEAVAAFRSALDQGFDEAKAELELGRCYALLGWKDQCLVHLDLSLAAGEGDPKVQATVDAMRAQEERITALQGPALLAKSGPFSLQGEVGFGWGLDQGSFGHRFGYTGNTTPFTYPYSEGQGFSYALEALLSISRNFAVGVSADPLDTDLSAGSSDSHAGTTTTDNTHVQELVLPVLLNAHTRASLGSSLKVACFAGVGGIFSQPYVEVSNDTVSDSTGTDTETVRYQRDLSPNLAFRGGFSLEWLLSPHCTAFAQASLLLAHLAPSGVIYSASFDNAKGAEMGSSGASDTYTSSPPPVLPSYTTPSIPLAGQAANSEKTYSFDDGPTQWTATVFYDKNGNLEPKKTEFYESNILSTAAGGDDIDLRVLALTAGLRWEF